MEEGREGKGVGGGRGLGGTGWWSICALRTEYSTLYSVVIVGVGNEKGICRLRFVST